MQNGKDISNIVCSSKPSDFGPTFCIWQFGILDLLRKGVPRPVIVRPSRPQSGGEAIWGWQARSFAVTAQILLFSSFIAPSASGHGRLLRKCPPRPVIARPFRPQSEGEAIWGWQTRVFPVDAQAGFSSSIASTASGHGRSFRICRSLHPRHPA